MSQHLIGPYEEVCGGVSCLERLSRSPIPDPLEVWFNTCIFFGVAKVWAMCYAVGHSVSLWWCKAFLQQLANASEDLPWCLHVVCFPATPAGCALPRGKGTFTGTLHGELRPRPSFLACPDCTPLLAVFSTRPQDEVVQAELSSQSHHGIHKFSLASEPLHLCPRRCCFAPGPRARASC